MIATRTPEQLALLRRIDRRDATGHALTTDLLNQNEEDAYMALRHRWRCFGERLLVRETLSLTPAGCAALAEEEGKS